MLPAWVLSKDAFVALLHYFSVAAWDAGASLEEMLLLSVCWVYCVKPVCVPLWLLPSFCAAARQSGRAAEVDRKAPVPCWKTGGMCV